MFHKKKKKVEIIKTNHNQSTIKMYKLHLSSNGFIKRGMKTRINTSFTEKLFRFDLSYQRLLKI